ncbi:MAG: hypothetical protein ACLGH0_02030, partial [Thermoanaerobaculia bacterium]
RSNVNVRGDVMMGNVPVVGAYVLAVPRDVPVQTGPQATSDVRGRFALSLPPGTRTYDVVVVPRGFYVTLGRTTVDTKKILRAEVGQDGGSLTVDASADEHPRIRHAGAEFSVPLLVQRAGGTVESSAKRQRLTIPNLEPGMYSVCGKAKCVSAYVPRFATASVSLQ